jgi:hypothetical protein
MVKSKSGLALSAYNIAALPQADAISLTTHAMSQHK